MFFFFIGGIDTKTETKKSKEPQYCERCHNTTHWILEKQRRWIVIFFIPVIPLGTKYFAYCPICHNGYEITREQYENG